MPLCRSLYSCVCGRRPSLLRKLLVLIVSLSVIFWVSLLGHQQRQSLLLNEQQDSLALNGVKFDVGNKGKNTPRVLMDANNGRALNHIASPEQPSKNITVKSIAPAGEDKPLKIENDEPSHAPAPQHVDSSRNSTNTSSQQDVAISKHTSLVASDTVHLDPVPSQKGPDSLQLLFQRMKKLNHQQRVLNADKFPPLSNSDGLVLIVQVHKRENYLKQLFESLKRAKGIEKVLLVISHDYFYDDMNAMVESVDFCRVSWFIFKSTNDKLYKHILVLQSYTCLVFTSALPKRKLGSVYSFWFCS